jgi:hypothetical protein
VGARGAFNFIEAYSQLAFMAQDGPCMMKQKKPTWHSRPDEKGGARSLRPSLKACAHLYHQLRLPPDGRAAPSAARPAADRPVEAI